MAHKLWTAAANSFADHPGEAQTCEIDMRYKF